MSSTYESVMKQRGADPPGRSKQVDETDFESSALLLEKGTATERHGRCRGRSLGRSTSSNRSFRKTASSRSLGRATTATSTTSSPVKSKRSRSLAASKNDSRSKSLNRNDKGTRSKSLGKGEPIRLKDDDRSKSRGRSERVSGAQEKERSKSRRRMDQKRTEAATRTAELKISSGNRKNGSSPTRTIKMTENHSDSTLSSPTITASKSQSVSGSGPMKQKRDTPLAPPRKSVPGDTFVPLATTQEKRLPPHEAEKHSGMTNASTSNRSVARSQPAQVGKRKTGRSPNRSILTDEIEVASSFLPFAREVGTSTRPVIQDIPDKELLTEMGRHFEASQSTEASVLHEERSETLKTASAGQTITLLKNVMQDPQEGHDGRPARASTAKANIPAMNMVASASLFVTILEGRMLVPLQRSMLGLRRHSDPFVESYLDNKLLGTTSCAHRTINPKWRSDNTFSLQLDGMYAKEMASQNKEIELRVYHAGKGGVSIFIGAARVPLMTNDRAEWHPVHQRSVFDDALFCANALGEIKVQVSFTAHSYPDLHPGHELLLDPHSKVALNLSWSGSPSLETSCVALDRKNGHVIWKECVYFANRINLSNSVARPEVQDRDDSMFRDSLVFDLSTVPETVAAFYVVVTMRDKSHTLSDIRFFQTVVMNETTREGIGRLAVNFQSKDSAAVLLRIARTSNESNSHWKLATIVRGYKVIREFGSLLPQLQDYSSDILPFIGPPAERTALMRCGDSLQLLDYVPLPIPSRLVIGFFWKVMNKEPLKVAASLLDEELREIDAIHRTKPGFLEQGVQYSGGDNEHEKFEVNFSRIALNVHYLCFVLGPFSRQKVDDIVNVACHIVNPNKGGCFHRAGNEWNFTILGLSSSETTFAGRLNDIRNHIFNNPLEPAASLPHPRLLKSVMPLRIPLPSPKAVDLSAHSLSTNEE